MHVFLHVSIYCLVYCFKVLKGRGFETLFIPVLSFKYTDSKTNGLIDAIMSPFRYSGVYLLLFNSIAIWYMLCCLGVIFTSQTAVNALVDTIEKEKLVIGMLTQIERQMARERE